VALGVDLFDCVQPTRLARHGTALTHAGRLRMKVATLAEDDGPVDPSCPCPVCGRYSRAYLRHLFVVGEPSAARLLTLHNLSWMLALMARIRVAIAAGGLGELMVRLAATWP
jgi:queuine tRNA-ribosyltransferase